MCRECHNARQREYYQNNREKRLEEKRMEYAENREKHRERNRKKYRKHREKALKKQKEYYENNKESIEVYRKGYYEKNKYLILAKMREYYYEDVDRTRAMKRVVNNRYSKTDKGKHNSLKHSFKRRSLLRDAKNTITTDEWDLTVDYFDGLCAYCGEAPQEVHRDHIIPVIKGGGNILGNLVISCAPCNLSKGSKDLDEWYPDYEKFDENRYQHLLKFLAENKRNEDE